MMIGRVAAGLLLAALAMEPAAAKELAFTARLSGDQAPTLKDSTATGQARLIVDTERQTVDLTLDVAGLTTDQLWDRLVAAPVGPIHLHLYGHDHGGAASASLALPVPYGPSYSATAGGFRVVVKGYPYAAGATLVKSTVPFDAFVTSLRQGAIVLNIHTDRATDGEISGTMTRATLP